MENEYYIYTSGAAGEGNQPSWGQRELKLVQSKRDIENPSEAATVEHIQCWELISLQIKMSKMLRFKYINKEKLPEKYCLPIHHFWRIKCKYSVADPDGSCHCIIPPSRPLPQSCKNKKQIPQRLTFCNGVMTFTTKVKISVKSKSIYSYSSSENQITIFSPFLHTQYYKSGGYCRL